MGRWSGAQIQRVAPRKWAITDMSGIKRGGKSRGSVRGHRFGVGAPELLGYRVARFRIYLPAYQWVLERKLPEEVERLRQIAAERPLVLLDYETNTDARDVSSPLSHAGLIMHHILGTWPRDETAEIARDATPNG